MKRVRPPMPPMSVRVEVAERQFKELWPVAFEMTYKHFLSELDWSLSRRLQWVLCELFQDGENVVPHELHHDPALILRPYDARIRNIAARYSPNANDPNALVYLAKDAHQERTTGRKPGAARTVTTKGSDIGIKTKFARLERKPRRKAKIASRLFGKQKRKFR